MISPTPPDPSNLKAETSEFPIAVLLAAGEGRRLREMGSHCPKPMVPLLGLSLAERCIANFMAAGVNHFLVVLGYRGETVRAHFEKIAERRGCNIRFVLAEDWEQGNGTSASAAKPIIQNCPFLLAMIDHVFNPEMIRAVLSFQPDPGEIRLAIDRHQGTTDDCEDLTKVTLRNGLVTEIGKDLKNWDAGDTGLFFCTSALFEGLHRARTRGRHSLSDGVRELIGQNRVRSIDVTGYSWIDIDTPEDYHEAERSLLQNLDKGGQDGYISQWLNRPISRRISRLLLRTGITPNQITLFSFLLFLVGAGCLASLQRFWWIIGGVTIQLASILDGCDGEIARLKVRHSARGAWLDTMLDRYADLAMAIAVTYSFASRHPTPWIWIAGLLCAVGFVLASYTTKEFELRFGRPFPNNLLNRMKRRDLRTLTVAIGAIIGYPFPALCLVGSLSHFCIIGILMSVWFRGNIE